MNQNEEAVPPDKEVPPMKVAAKDLEGDATLAVDSVLTSRAILEGNIKRANEGDMRGDDRLSNPSDEKPPAISLIITSQPIYKAAQQFGSIPGGATVSEGEGNFLLWPSQEICKRRGRFLVWPADKKELPAVSMHPPPTEVVIDDKEQADNKNQTL